MAGTASPGGGEGPTFAPPPLPAGWIAQWDGSSRKYYFVQISTGVSQWDTPTSAAPVGGGTPTPSHADTEHPYGIPNSVQGANGAAKFITHPDGSQTIQHPDGRMEPVMPSEDGPVAGTRGMDGPGGDRGLGSFAVNMLQSQLSHGNSHGGSSSSGGNALLGQLIGGITHSGGNSGSHGGSSASSGIGGKLASQLASNLFSSNNKPAPQNYHGTPTAHTNNSGGIAGAVMGGVVHMFAGNQHQNQNQNFGYSGSGQSGTYSGAAPPTSYQSAAHTQYNTPPGVAPSTASLGSQPPQQQQQPHQQQRPANTGAGVPSYAPPPSSAPGQPAYGGSQPQHHQPQHHQPPHHQAQQQNHPSQAPYQQYPPAPYGGTQAPPPGGYAPSPGGQPGGAPPGGAYGGGTPGYYPPPPQQQQPPAQYGQPQYGGPGGHAPQYGAPPQHQQNTYAPGGYGGAPRY